MTFGGISSGWLNYWQFLIRMAWLLAVSHRDDLTIGSISSGWLMCIAGCHLGDLRYSPISDGWHNIIWTLSHPDEITMLIPKSSGWLSYRQYLIQMTCGYCRMSSGWLLDTAVCHPDDISYHHMPSGWLSRNWYLIRMSYNNVIISSGCHTLPFLSHPDEIANLDFPQHAMTLQLYRT